MANIFSGTILPSAASNILVGTGSATAVSLNIDRQGLVLVNISNSTIYLGLNVTATLHAGIALNPAGGTWVMDEYNFTVGPITAIAHSAGNILTIQEFTRYP